MGKIKIYEIAKETGLTSKEIIEKANEMGLDVKSHASGVDEKEAIKIKEAFSKNKPSKSTNKVEAKNDIKEQKRYTGNNKKRSYNY